jgi:acetyl-CoA acetyltransferase
MNTTGRQAAITGVGVSAVGRRLGRGATDLTVEAALAALKHAGLTRDDIDGVTTYPGQMHSSPGMSPIGCPEIREALGLKVNWHSSSAEGPAQLSAIMIAAMAVATGQARHVMCFRTLTESSSQTATQRASVVGGGLARVDPRWQFLLPFNAASAANWSAMFAQAYMHRFGATREMLAHVSLNQRANAALNPLAVLRKPLTLDEYMSTRMISSPLCMLDCDIPVDGSAVIIISAMDAARDLPHRPIRIEAMGSAHHGRESWDQRADITTMAAHDAAAQLWSRTDLKPSDVDVACLYDGFSIHTLMWLEAFGFCKHGEAAAFVAGGHTKIGAQLPLNTNGGQLSAGRLHAFGHVVEACTQLWGEAGARQVANAQVAAVGAGGGPIGGALLLTRQ